MTIDPEELTVAYPPQALRREPGEWARDDGDRMAIYALAYRRRARGAATQAAVATTLLCLLASVLMNSPWIAVAGFAACPLVYTVASRILEGRLSTRLGVSRAALSASVARFMASPEGAAQAAMLERGAAQVRIEGDRNRLPIAGE